MTTVADAAVLVTSGAGLSILPKATLVLALLDGTQRRGRVGMAPRGRVSPASGSDLVFQHPGKSDSGSDLVFRLALVEIQDLTPLRDDPLRELW